MRKIIDGNVYELGMVQGNREATIRSEAERLYPKKKFLIRKAGTWYQIWVLVRKATAADLSSLNKKVSKEELLVQEFKEKMDSLIGAANEFRWGLPSTVGKITADIHALQLLDEWGPVVTAKKAFTRVFPRRKVAFLKTSAGTVGVAYSGILTKSDRDFIRYWAGA